MVFQTPPAAALPGPAAQSWTPSVEQALRTLLLPKAVSSLVVASTLWARSSRPMARLVVLEGEFAMDAVPTSAS